jgi:hypothetical protein
MKLITKGLEKRFKQIGSQEHTPLKDQIIVAKFFNPTGRGTWFLTEYDPETKIAFGFVSIFGDWNDEWGSFAVWELEEYKGQFGLGIERDIHWTERKASEVDIINANLTRY